MEELVEALVDPPKFDGAEFLTKLKTAGLADVARVFFRQATANPVGLAGGAVGAALFGAAAYKANKPGPDGLSTEQKAFGAAADAMKKRETERTSPPSLPEEITGVGARTSKEMADVFARHPRTAALSAALIGAGLGSRVAPKLVKLIKPIV